MSRVWFITGAGRGMGVDIAKTALAAGNAVVATGRNTDAVAKAVGAADDLLIVKLDVTSRADAEAAVDLDRFGEKLSRFVAVARTVAVEEHAGVESPDFRLLDDVGQLLGSAEGGAEVVLGLCPLAATSGRYARYRIQQAGIVRAKESTCLYRLQRDGI